MASRADMGTPLDTIPALAKRGRIVGGGSPRACTGRGGLATSACVKGTRDMGNSLGRPLPAPEAARVDGGALVARILGEQAVRYCFTVNGGHIWPILSHLREHDVKMIHMRHEQSCAYAA